MLCFKFRFIRLCLSSSSSTPLQYVSVNHIKEAHCIQPRAPQSLTPLLPAETDLWCSRCGFYSGPDITPGLAVLLGGHGDVQSDRPGCCTLSEPLHNSPPPDTLQGAYPGHDWFASTVFLIMAGDMERALRLLLHLSTLLTSAFLWPARLHGSVSPAAHLSFFQEGTEY